MASVKETIESGITPIVLEFSKINFFESEEKLARSFLTINSLDLGVLTYEQYRFVARRTKQGNHLVERHLQKLFRIIALQLDERPDVSCYTIPAYARLLKDGELAAMIVEAMAMYPEVSPDKVCIELSADILYEDLEMARSGINQLRELGLKIALCEVGDEFCPVFRLSELPFDYAFMDKYSTASLDRDDCERVAGSLVGYLHHLNVKVIAPGLDSEEKIAGAKQIGCDGYTSYDEVSTYAEGGAVSNEETLLN